MSRGLSLLALVFSADLGASLLVRPAAMRRPVAGDATVRHACFRHASVRMADEDGEEPDPSAVINDAKDKMKKSISVLQDSLATLRVGRANPALLDRVEVDYYGAPTPLNQLASVTAPTATQLVIDV